MLLIAGGAALRSQALKDSAVAMEIILPFVSPAIAELGRGIGLAVALRAQPACPACSCECSPALTCSEGQSTFWGPKQASDQWYQGFCCGVASIIIVLVAAAVFYVRLAGDSTVAGAVVGKPVVHSSTSASSSSSTDLAEEARKQVALIKSRKNGSAS